MAVIQWGDPAAPKMPARPNALQLAARRLYLRWRNIGPDCYVARWIMRYGVRAWRRQRLPRQR